MKQFSAIAVVILFVACNGNDKEKEEVDNSLKRVEAPKLAYNIVNVYPHDTSAYTQGLQLYNGKLMLIMGVLNDSKNSILLDGFKRIFLARSKLPVKT